MRTVPRVTAEPNKSTLQYRKRHKLQSVEAAAVTDHGKI